MKKILMGMIAILIVSMSLAYSASAGDIKIKNLRILEEYTEPAEELITWVDLDDLGVGPDDVKATVVVQELGIKKSVRFDPDDNKRIILELPADTAPGTYYARVTITSQDGSGVDKRVKYRWFEVQ